MTVQEILDAVETHRPMSRRTLYTHIDALGVKPLGEVRQKPQHYPDNTPQLILKRLGVVLTTKHTRKAGAR